MIVLARAVALANTLFFAAATGESKDKVALYLLITIAPFAVVAPLIGPALDRLQHGRRVALAASFALRTGLAVLLISNYDGATGSYPSWVLYPCALAMMVLSKSFSVLRSAVTPRVMPPTIDLVRVKGKHQPVGCYELLGERGRTAPQEDQLLADFGRGMEAYRAGDFARALEVFRATEALEADTGAGINPSRLYQERCRQLLEKPPEKWDGVWTLTSK